MKHIAVVQAILNSIAIHPDVQVKVPRIMPGNPLYFRQGGTSTYVQKPIKYGNKHRYSIRAIGEQTMILTVSSPNKDVYLDVYSTSGKSSAFTLEITIK
jgi:hypothetical protein